MQKNGKEKLKKKEKEKQQKNLGKNIKHIHIKDSLVENGKINYCFLGEGDLPVKEILQSLMSINYEGYISLEVMPEWLGSLGDENIVLPQFSSYMSTFNMVPVWQKKLFLNKSDNGNIY